MSEYGLQLREKQKAKFIYGVLEKPFRNYYERADRMKGQTGENLMIMLESRLDNVVFRLGLARTRREARQIVDHKHVLVNGKQINIPSYLVKAGDVIEIKEKCRGSQRYKDIVEATGGRLVPEWLESDLEALKGTVKELPSRDAIDVPVLKRCRSLGLEPTVLGIDKKSTRELKRSSRNRKLRLQRFQMIRNTVDLWLSRSREAMVRHWAIH